MPASLVIDASVALKWYFPETLGDEADALLESKAGRFIAPDLMMLEAAQACVKKTRRGEITPERCIEITEQLATMITAFMRPSADLALALALKHQISVYDAAYAALAIAEGCPFVTADHRLYNALAAALPDTMLWVADPVSDDA